MRKTRIAHRPDDYLFPFRVNRCTWDPSRPASPSWLRKQTARLRKASGISHLRPHAFRHLAVTELLEEGVPEQTVIALAGWVSGKMLSHYGHHRLECKFEAVNRLKRPDLPVPAPSSVDSATQPEPMMNVPRLPLTDLDVEHAMPKEKAYRISDAGNLYLWVTPPGRKMWRWGYIFQGKEKLMSFGRYPDVPLAEARTRHAEARELLARGVDPMAERKAEKAADRPAIACRDTRACAPFKPTAPQPAQTLDIAHPAIQAEIQRQIALALQGMFAGMGGGKVGG